MTANGALAAAAVSLMDVPERGDGLKTSLLRNNDEKLVQRHSDASALVPFGMAFIIDIGLSILFMGVEIAAGNSSRCLPMLAIISWMCLASSLQERRAFDEARALLFNFPPIPFKLSRIFKCLAEREETSCTRKIKAVDAKASAAIRTEI